MMIIVSYPVKTLIGLDSKKDDEIRKLAESMGGKSIGSGSGCSYRDLEFKFIDHEKSEAFMKVCENLDLRVSIMD